MTVIKAVSQLLIQMYMKDFLETIAGLKLKGSDIISREASKLLTRIEGGGA